jgi:hypothetical protein
VDPRSPEFQAKAFALFDARMAAEKARKEKFGEVRPIMHTEAWGKRLIGVENQIYSMDPRATFADFLREYLREALGPAWWNQELAKPLAGRHQVARWQLHLEELMQGETDEHGRYVVETDGLLSALLNLAYDLFIVKDNIRFHERTLDRLRRREHFVGVRYELLVAAAFVRAGFQVDPEDESDSSSTHPEFLATHRATNFVIAVEAKARNRRPSDRTPARAGVDDLVARAAQQAPKNEPFALFVDVAMPPEDRTKPPSWTDEVDQTVRAVVERNGGMPGPFDWVFFTNIPHQWGLSGEADPPRHFLDWLPRACRIPEEIRHAIVTAMQQHGNIPKFEAKS